MQWLWRAPLTEIFCATPQGKAVYIGYAPKTGCISQTVRRDGVEDAALAVRDLTDNQKRRMKMNWYLMVLKKYAQFSGRSRRKELWMFALFNMLICFVLEILGIILRENALGKIILGLLFIYALATLIPGLAVAIRRLHDTGKSGWWLLICIVPFVGPIILLVFYVLDSQPGANQYGPNPKGA